MSHDGSARNALGWDSLPIVLMPCDEFHCRGRCHFGDLICGHELNNSGPMLSEPHPPDDECCCDECGHALGA